MGAIYLVRHGQASFGAEDYDQLSSLGAEQSRVLGFWIRHCNLKVDRVVMGGHERHRQTAKCCLAVPGKVPPESQWQVASGFSEFDMLEVVRRFRPELCDQAAINSWLASTQDPRREYQNIFAPAFERWVKGEHNDYSESFASFRTRCWQALSALLEDTTPSLTTWVFTSGGPISAIVQHALAIANERIAELTWVLVNTGITKLLYRPDGVRAATINQYAHLEQIGRAEWITYR